MQSTVTSKGQVTLPKAVRDRMGLKPGDKVKFFVSRHGHLTMLPVVPPQAVAGFLKDHYKGPPISIEEMNDGVEAAVTEDNAIAVRENEAA